jgi:flavoprotein
MKWLKRLFGIHKHNYVVPETIHGISLLKCDYPGCNCYDTSPEQDAKDKKEFDDIMRKIDEFRKRRAAL